MALFHQIKRVDECEEIRRKQEKAFAAHYALGVHNAGLGHPINNPGFGAPPELGKRGRKPDPNAKQLLTLRLDPQVIEHFRSTGEGWQTRMNDALRKAAGL
ncbi:BrnA antitoxin family protein [Rhizobium hidalgonense]|uniref:BrnA antitoxin family protein n=1 Tax=Rhizobium hidalgonense TaxID=1538159 RepID=A0AAJ2LN24_9HYPH|nr:BrnA antitoxin family protein [Rhizobium hidalgonense]MDR9777212.1 BrnA antitoxin family protein [Rhizobium hidalgonense]